MLDEENGINTNTLKLIGSLIVVFFMLVFIITAPSKGEKKENDIETGEVNKEDILLLFNQIENNYALTITQTVNDETKTLELLTNSRVNLYEGDMLDRDGYLYYDGKLFYIDSDNYKIVKTDKQYDFINDPYYDLNMIKRIVNYCEFSYENEVKANCKMKLSEYFKEYNEKYNTNYNVDDDKELNIVVVHYSNKIEKVIIDYSDINKIIKDSDDEVSYGIRFDDYDDNTIQEIFNKYKTEIE